MFKCFRSLTFALLLTTVAAPSLALALTADDPDRIVPAHEEPRHVPKLDNGVVRVIDVEIPVGEQTMFHRHSLDYPYLMLSSVTLDNEIYGTPPKPVKIGTGFIGYYRASTQGAYVHRFINRGPGSFRAIGIELLRPIAFGASTSVAAPDAPGMTTVLDNERVRAWRLHLEPGASIGPVTLPGPGLRVAMSAGRLSEMAGDSRSDWTAEPATFAYRAAPKTVTLTNTGSAPIEWVEFEFK